MRLLITCVLIGFIGNSLSGQSAISLGQSDKIELRGSMLRIYMDTLGKESIGTIIDKRTLFSINQQQVPTFFMTKTYYWVSFELIIDTTVDHVIELNNSVVDDFELYAVGPDTQIIKMPKISWYVPSSERALPTWRNALSLPSLRYMTIYARVHKPFGTLHIPFILWNKRAFDKSELRNHSGTIFFFGVAAIIAVLCVLVFINTRQLKFIFYLGYVLSILFWRAFIEGFFVPILQTGYMHWANPLYGNFLIVLALSFYLLFIKYFLIEKGVSPVYHARCLNVLLGIVGFSTFILIAFGIEAFTFPWLGWIYIATVIGTIGVSILIMWAGIRRRQLSALLYMVSALPLFVNAILTVLSNAELLSSHWQPTYSMFDALVFEIFILCIGLALDFKKFTKEQKNREIEAIRQTQKEKERISRDLHDTVGGQLSYVLYSMDDIQKEVGEHRQDIIEDMNSTLRNVMGNLRETIWAIHDEKIGVKDISDRLKVYAKNLFRHRQVEINYKENITQIRYLPSSQTLNIFRICQEILNNAFKHSQATRISIELNDSDDFQINISDNGVGFDVKTVDGGMGLANMRRRAEENHITLICFSKPGGGTTYQIVVMS